MQRLPRTFRLFQVLAIIKSIVLFSFFGLLVFLTSCSGDPAIMETNSLEEVFEPLPISACDSIAIGNYSVWVPKDLSVSDMLNYQEIASLSNLYHEIHCHISIVSKDKAGSITDSTFKTICDNYIVEDERKLNGPSEIVENYSSQVNGRRSNYTRLKAKSYGFPLDQSISYRFIQFDGEMVVFKFWTPLKDFEKWANYEDVITSTFTEIKKG